MGFFDSIVHAVTSPVEHLIGKTATNILFPIAPVYHISAGIADKALGLAGHILTPAPRQTMASSRHPYSPAQVNAPAPFYSAPGYGYAQQAPTYFGGGGSQLSFPEAQPAGFQGGSPWDFSTPSTTFSPAPWATYSAPQPQTQDRSWEDLALAAIPLFL
jgi:hypothetical protein